MRFAVLAAALSLGIVFAAPAAAQSPPAPPLTAPGAPTPVLPTQTSPTPASSAPQSSCTPRTVPLGGIGRASVVAFRGVVFGENVCALVANLAFDGFHARFADAPSGTALVTAAVMPGSGALVSAADGYSLTAVPADTSNVPPGPVAVGPFAVAPGGQFAVAGGDTTEVPRVVLAFSGQRDLLIGTTAVTLVDLARILRDQPGIFGADAIERAVVLASGPAAALQIVTANGTLGTPVFPPARVLEIAPR